MISRRKLSPRYRRRLMRRASVLVLLITTLFCLEASADQVRLKNGDQLSGKIIKSDTKALLLKTEFAGDVTIAWEAVTEVISEAPLYVTLADGRTVSGPVRATGERIEVQAE